MPHLPAVDRLDWTMASRESLQGAPAAAGGPHLHLDGAYVPFCLIRGEPDGKVGGEPQDHVLAGAEPAGQPQPVLAGLGALALVVCDWKAPPFPDCGNCIFLSRYLRFQELIADLLRRPVPVR